MRLMLPVCCLYFAVIVQAGQIKKPDSQKQTNQNANTLADKAKIDEGPDSTPVDDDISDSRGSKYGNKDHTKFIDKTKTFVSKANTPADKSKIDEDPDSTPVDDDISDSRASKSRNKDQKKLINKTPKFVSKAAKDLHTDITVKKATAKAISLDRQFSKIREDLEDSSNKEAEKQEMLKDLHEIHNQRMRLKMLIGGYSFAQMILTIGQYIPVLNVYLATGAAGINLIKGWLVEPLDESFRTHQEAYANAVAHFLEKYPEYRKGFKRLPSHLKIKMKNGEELELRVLKQKEDEELPEKSLHLNNKGPFELATMAMQMR